MTDTPKKPSSLKQRSLTALVLVPILIAVLALGGWFAAIVALISLCIALHEEMNTLQAGGYRPVRWPAFAALVAGAALVFADAVRYILPLTTVLIFGVQMSVMCRKDSQMTDIMAGVLPMMNVALPGICLLSILSTEPRPLQLMMLLFVFGTAIGCDTLAYFVGSMVGGPKLCPHISPKKTVSGAIGGLAGSVLFAVVIDLCFRAIAPEVIADIPLWWTMVLGLLCGVAAQMGDLFASMLKRLCKVKDFGHIFPGHGGMMDRLDSVLFTSIVVFAYRALLLGLL